MASSNENVEILKESFYFEDEKIILATDQVKSIISDAMQSFSEWLEYADFTSNILGSATHLSFNFSTLEYGKVDSATKKADLDYYNEKHKTLTALAEEAEIVGVDDATFDSDFKAQLDSIKGNKITVKGIFSDGSEAEKIDDYKSTNQPIKLTIWGYDVIEESDGSAKIRLYLTYAEGTYASTLYSKGIPYGIIACDREIAIA